MNISQNYALFNNIQQKNNQKNTNFKGWKPDNLTNLKQINQLKKLITDTSNQRIAVSGHFGPDGDCISSGTTVRMVQEDNRKIIIRLLMVPEKSVTAVAGIICGSK